MGHGKGFAELQGRLRAAVSRWLKGWKYADFTFKGGEKVRYLVIKGKVFAKWVEKEGEWSLAWRSLERLPLR
jgi:hypothetical protein